MYPLLSASPCSMSSSQFPLAFSPVFPWTTGAGVWHTSCDKSQEAGWLWCCRCYAWCCSVLRRPKPWEHGALRNVSKYSFRLPPFLPLSSQAAPPPLLINLGYTGTAALRLKKLTYYFSFTSQDHCAGKERTPQPPQTATVS